MRKVTGSGPIGPAPIFALHILFQLARFHLVFQTPTYSSCQLPVCSAFFRSCTACFLRRSGFTLELSAHSLAEGREQLCAPSRRFLDAQWVGISPVWLLSLTSVSFTVASFIIPCWSFLFIYLHVCGVFVCVQVCAHMCAYACKAQRSVLCVFFKYSSPYCFEAASPTELGVHKTQGSFSLCLPSARLTGV